LGRFFSNVIVDLRWLSGIAVETLQSKLQLHL
jgi:hypothetical protein